MAVTPFESETLGKTLVPQPHGGALINGTNYGNKGGGRPKDINRALATEITTKGLRKTSKGLDDGTVSITEAMPIIKYGLAIAESVPISIDQPTMLHLVGMALKTTVKDKREHVAFAAELRRLIESHADALANDTAAELSE